MIFCPHCGSGSRDTGGNIIHRSSGCASNVARPPTFYGTTPSPDIPELRYLRAVGEGTEKAALIAERDRYRAALGRLRSMIDDCQLMASHARTTLLAEIDRSLSPAREP